MPSGDIKKRRHNTLRQESPVLSSEQTVYLDVMDVLTAAGIPFLVGGGFALTSYTGMARVTKDLDLFVLPADFSRIMEVCSAAGYQTKVRFTHWLGKVSKMIASLTLFSLLGTDSAWSTRSGFSMPFLERFLIDP